MMKKIFLVCFVAALLAGISSCASAPVKVKVDNIKGDQALAVIQPSEYTVLGRIIGLGKITYKIRSGEITGDTFKYGFIDQDIDPNLGDIVKLGRFKTGYLSYSSPVEVARANAVAQMIESANAMGADRVIYVTYSVTREAAKNLGTEEISVTARGIGIKLNMVVPEPEPAEPDPESEFDASSEIEAEYDSGAAPSEPEE